MTSPTEANTPSQLAPRRSVLCSQDRRHRHCPTTLADTTWNATQAVEVYTKLTEANPENAPDLVIGGKPSPLARASPQRRILSGADSAPVCAADTVVVLPLPSGAILEKPRSKEDQMGMLSDYNGSTVSVVTGVTIGEWRLRPAQGGIASHY